MLLVVVACSSSSHDDAAPSPAFQVQDAVRSALGRLGPATRAYGLAHGMRGGAVLSVERLDRILRGDFRERIELLEAIVREPAPRGETPAERKLRENVVRVAQERIQDLQNAAVESALRGDASVYQLRADIFAELEYLRALAEHVGLTPTTIPAEEHVWKLLERSSLTEIDGHLERLRRHFEWLRAKAPPSIAVEYALRDLASQRERIADAIAHPIDLTERFASAPGLERSDAVWLAKQDQARDAASRRRRAELLQQALARDPHDLQAAVELQRLKDPRPEVAHTLARVQVLEHARHVRVDALEELQKRSPFVAERLSPVVAAMVRARALDPVRGAWLEAQLRSTYEGVRDQLGPRARLDFEAWLATLLDTADLVEADAWFNDVRRRVALIRASEPPGVAERSDLGAIEVEAIAVAAEVSERGTSSSKRTIPEGINITLEVPVRASQVPKRLHSSFWQALERLAARMGESLRPSTRSMIAELALEGYASEISRLALDADELVRLSSWMGARPFMVSDEGRAGVGMARNTVDRRIHILRASIRELQAESSGSVVKRSDELLRNIDIIDRYTREFHKVGIGGIASSGTGPIRSGGLQLDVLAQYPDLALEAMRARKAFGLKEETAKPFSDPDLASARSAFKEGVASLKASSVRSDASLGKLAITTPTLAEYFGGVRGGPRKLWDWFPRSLDPHHRSVYSGYGKSRPSPPSSLEGGYLKAAWRMFRRRGR